MDLLAEYGEEIERVRSALAAPPLRRSEKDKPGADPKWEVGDALLAVPLEVRDEVADHVQLKRSDARQYWRTSYAWPPEDRTVPASWTTYRTLVKLPHRRDVIYAGMKYRDAQFAATGRYPDRKGVHMLEDDRLLRELLEIYQSDRADTILPKLLEGLSASKEGRRTLRNRRTTAALRKLHEEMRQLDKEIEKLRKAKGPQLRLAEEKRRLLQIEGTVEAMVFIFNEEREAIDDDTWQRLGEKLSRLGDRAHKAGDRILRPFTSVDVEVLDAEAWTVEELSGGGRDIVDAEIVDEG